MFYHAPDADRAEKTSRPDNRREEIHVSDIRKTIGLQEALEMTLAHTHPLPAVQVPLLEGLNRIVAADVSARVDSPSVDASLMDGYAVKTSDLSGATRDRPVVLEVSGTVTAGSPPGLVVESQQTLRVMTGAPIPSGADGVVPEEFATRQGDLVLFNRCMVPGSNILPKGNDVAMGHVVAKAGCPLTPGLLGMLAAAGYSELAVVQPPEIALVATGDEVILPGKPLADGSLYASNIVTLDGWCRRYGFGTRLCVVGDTFENICRILEQTIDQVDVLVSSGGTRAGDKDLMIQALEHLGWKEVFRRIAMTPGKGVGFGFLHHKPVFVLPGGPSANVMGFMQIALPGLLSLAGYGHTGLPEMNVQLAGALKGRHMDWTQFVFGTLERQGSRHIFHPLLTRSRLESVAIAEAVVAISEGKMHLPAGTVVKAQILASVHP